MSSATVRRQLEFVSQVSLQRPRAASHLHHGPPSASRREPRIGSTTLWVNDLIGTNNASNSTSTRAGICDPVHNHPMARREAVNCGLVLLRRINLAFLNADNP